VINLRTRLKSICFHLDATSLFPTLLFRRQNTQSDLVREYSWALASFTGAVLGKKLALPGVGKSRKNEVRQPHPIASMVYLCYFYAGWRGAAGRPIFNAARDQMYSIGPDEIAQMGIGRTSNSSIWRTATAEHGTTTGPVYSIRPARLRNSVYGG
jgi:hypothetical protein